MFRRFAKITLPTLRKPASLVRLEAFLARHLKRLGELIAPARESAKAWYDNREPREKTLLRVLGVILTVLFLYEAVYTPIVNLRENLAERAAVRQQDLLDVRAMMRTYQRLRVELARTEKRTVAGGKDFSLFSVVEQTLTKSVSREKIGSITPGDRAVNGGLKQYTVDVKLTGISLAQVVDTLYGVQTLALPVTVSNLQLHEHAQDSRSYDVDMTCMAVGKNG
jgi:type II secretory pathway component PulM